MSRSTLISSLQRAYKIARTSIGNGTPKDQAQILIPQLNKVFPGISELLFSDESIRAFWSGDRYTRGSYSCYLVGQWTKLAGAEAERVGNLFFAGEHCSVEAQGYMEGGCASGEAVALEILQDLGMKASASQQQARIFNNKKPLKNYSISWEKIL